jgi:hypothetical protein
MSTRCTRTTLLLVLSVVALSPTLALAATAGTGTATVSLTSLLSSPKVSVTADFDGAIPTFSASNVALSGVNIATGANFSVPFSAGASGSFTAVGTISCPATGCATLPGTFSFVGVLSNITTASFPAGSLYTFDGSVSCTGNVVTGINCTGPFALNSFSVEGLGTGSSVTASGDESFTDPSLGTTRSYSWEVTCGGVTVGGDVSVAGLSKVRGALPAGISTAAAGFRGLYFDASSTATFTSARVCIEVDMDEDGIVDGTSIPVSALVILHLESGAFVAKPGFDLLGFACADGLTSLSPFVLAVDTTALPTTTTTTVTTTTLPGGSSTSTTISGPGGTTTTVPTCSTASQCLSAIRSGPLCPEGGSAALQKTIDKKLKAASAKIAKASTATGAKAAKLSHAAGAALQAIETKADKFLTKKKGSITSDCRERIRKALAPVRSALDASHF